MIENVSNSASYTMDYESNEIVVTVYTKDSQVETRFTEKDIVAMKNWFTLAKHMKSTDIEER
ncbi:hypothetical protein D3C78_1692040 [compost metagenome]